MRYVLFVCNHNAGRSQMAQALFERHAPEDVRAESAGSAPADHVWPNVIEVMRELDVDLSARRPKRLTVEMQLHADWAVTMGCGDACPYVPTRVEDWDVRDPAHEPIEVVREIRDEIEGLVRGLIDGRLEQIRSDRTAHQMRLTRLLPDLVREFEGLRTPEEIRRCADAILDGYADAPVRSFVMTVAHSRTRECLRRETCDALAPPGA
ncbi:MAG: arsenate reductase ArsC [Thermoleophilaceae bacterium]|nr:arsenate reductase ArsC [Thermoleophilaceae bacterium]